MKKIIISNNFLSDISNNGKTLKFLLKNYKEEDLIWLYTTPTENDLPCNIERALVTPFKSRIKLNKNVIISNGLHSSSRRHSILKYHLKFFNRHIFIKKLLKILRDVLFSFKYKKIFNSFISEIQEYDIDSMVFVAGDLNFVHRMAVDVSNYLDVPLSVFLTDDYIFEYDENIIRVRSGFSSRWLVSSFQKTYAASSSNHFISNKMKKVYCDFFKVDGCLSFNGAGINRDNEYFHDSLVSKDVYRLKYFGSLHSGRDSALIEFLKIINDFNFESKKKIHLDLYVNDPSLIKNLSCKLSSFIKLLKPVQGVDYDIAMAQADGLLLIESFDRSNLKNTWLSFSTKVMEYLDSGKAIIAYGPIDNPSIGDLVNKKAALYIKKPQDFNMFFSNKDRCQLINNANHLRTELESLNTLL